jgi:hypothetical protein
MKDLNPNAAGLSAATLSATGMLILGLLGLAGVYTEGIEAMQAWHIWFDITFVGILLGMLEAAVSSYVVVYLWVSLYNKFL